ncbi:MAG TPA: hypothetical protein PKD05_18890 [Candidatus Melainabacteria bacterium]|nr:hypothetical protein [Candidatus Melainabacteria bacterium]
MFIILVLLIVFSQPYSAMAKDSEVSVAKESITLFTGIERGREVFEILKEIAPDMKAKGGPEDWTRIEINLDQGGVKTDLVFNNDRTYYQGKSWQLERLGMYEYISKFPEAQHKQRALRLVQRFNFAVAAVLSPPRIKDDERLKLILKLSERIKAIMFIPGSLMDSSGRIIISQDGFSDPQARVDL